MVAHNYILQHCTVCDTVYTHILQHCTVFDTVYTHILQHCTVCDTVYTHILQHCTVCDTLYSVAWQPKFQRPISLSTSGFGDCKVARVGRPAIEYKLVVRPWESGIQPCISCHVPTV